MLIYRVQGDNALGPYNGGLHHFPERWEMGSAHNDSTHLPPYMDAALGGMSSSERSATDSPASLLAWFKGFWDALACAGFHIAIVDAPVARVGQNGQVVYGGNSATEVRRLTIPEFRSLHDNTEEKPPCS